MGVFITIPCSDIPTHIIGRHLLSLLFFNHSFCLFNNFLRQFRRAYHLHRAAFVQHEVDDLEVNGIVDRHQKRTILLLLDQPRIRLEAPRIDRGGLEPVQRQRADRPFRLGFAVAGNDDRLHIP